jgi:predicted ATPase
MQIQSLTAGNFKSLVEFRIDLAKFSCLIGLNGAGKSTVLQFIDFMAQQMRGDLQDWLNERSWKSGDLPSKLTSGKRLIELSVTLKNDGEAKPWSWTATFNPSQKLLRCTTERLETSDAVLEVENGQLRIHPQPGQSLPPETARSEKISFEYQGSILSQLKESTLPPSLVAFKQHLANVKSLDLLSPAALREKTGDTSHSLGLGGRRLAAFLHGLGEENQQQLADELRKGYPQLTKLHVAVLKSKQKQLEISERFNGRSLSTEARHINDGLLRLLAIFAELKSDNRFLLFDEIENGINPELIEFVINRLVNTPQQVLVTTHSPMILNYLEDATATEGVVYLYKTSHGETKSLRFFSIPSLRKKLTVMGPGEAFVDTDLTALQQEILEMPREKS